MAHSNNSTVNKFWQSYSERSTRNTKRTSIGIDDIPSLLAGDDQIRFQVGQTVITTGLGQMNKGIKLTVERVELIHGFANYLAGGCWHKQIDLSGEVE